jgi:hypothetical protein
MRKLISGKFMENKNFGEVYEKLYFGEFYGTLYFGEVYGTFNIAKQQSCGYGIKRNESI